MMYISYVYFFFLSLTLGLSAITNQPPQSTQTSYQASDFAPTSLKLRRAGKAEFIPSFVEGADRPLGAVICLQDDEIQKILTDKESYAYFGPAVGNLVDDLPVIHGQASYQSKEHLDAVCALIAAGRTTAPTRVLKAALEEAASCLNSMPNVSSDEIEKLAESIETYYKELETGTVEFIVNDATEQDIPDRAPTNKLFTGNITVNGNSTTKGDENVYGNLSVRGNETILGDVSVGGDETIGGNLTVNGAIISNGSGGSTGSFTLTGNPQQACLIFQDSNLNEKARICSSPIPGDKGVFVSVDGGTTQNLRVANNGNTIITPESGSATTALTVNGVVGAPAILATGNSTSAAPALRLIGDPGSLATDFLLTIDNSGNVRQSSGTQTFGSLPFGNFIVNGGQPGPLTIGTTNATTMSFITSNAQRILIDSNGSVTINTPAGGEFGLIIMGGGESVTGTTNINTTGGATTTIGNCGGGGTNTIAGTTNINTAGACATNIGNAASTTMVAGPTNINTTGAATTTIGNCGGGGTNTISGTTNINTSGICNTTIGNASSTTAVTGPTNINTSGAATTTIGNNGPSILAINASTTISATSAIPLNVTGNASNPTIVSTGSGTATAPALRLFGDPGSLATDFLLTIDNSGNVRQSSATQLFGSLSFSGASGVSGSFVINGGQAGPVTIGTTNATTLAFITNNINRLTIDQTGNSTFTGNIKLPAATPNVSTANATGATSGLLEFGGANPSSSNISMFEIGTRNIFEGNYGTTPNVSGNDNIAIGINALSGITTGTGNIAIGPFASSVGTPLSTARNTIAIGNSANAQGSTDSVVIGNSATAAGFSRSIVLGSRDSTNGIGAAPTVGAVNAIAIGSASGTFNGASATGIAAIAIGGSDTGSNGASAGGGDSISIGTNSSSSGLHDIAMGLAAAASNTNSIAIGTLAIASNTNTIAIGSLDTGANGAQALNIQSIAIGSGNGARVGATSGGTSAIAIGSANAQTAGANSGGNCSIAIGSGSSTAGGTPVGAIAIGGSSNSSALAGASATGLAAVAIGGSDNTFTGASSTGTRSIAIGTAASVGSTSNDSIVIGSRANTNQKCTIVIGSNDNGGGGTAPSATGINAIVIGSANAGVGGASASGNTAIAIGGGFTPMQGPTAVGLASVAIGGSDGINNGATVNAPGTRSVAIGNGAVVSQSDAIILGNVGTNVLSVGIGTNQPTAKLTISGTGAGGVTPLRLVTPPLSTSTDFLLTIDNSGNVRQSSATQLFSSLPFGNFIINGGQPGPLTIGTTNATSLTFITNNTQRFQVNATGNVTIAQPASGNTLTVNGTLLTNTIITTTASFAAFLPTYAPLTAAVSPSSSVAFYGDSITKGGQTDTGGSVTSWPQLVANRFGFAYANPGVAPTGNLAVSGNQIDDLGGGVLNVNNIYQTRQPGTNGTVFIAMGMNDILTAAETDFNEQRRGLEAATLFCCLPDSQKVPATTATQSPGGSWTVFTGFPGWGMDTTTPGASLTANVTGRFVCFAAETPAGATLYTDVTVDGTLINNSARMSCFSPNTQNTTANNDALWLFDTGSAPTATHTITVARNANSSGGSTFITWFGGFNLNNPNCNTVFLNSVTDAYWQQVTASGLTGGSETRRQTLNGILQDIARKFRTQYGLPVYFIDVSYPSIFGMMISSAPGDATPNVHPNNDGQQYMANRVISVIQNGEFNYLT